MQFPSTSSLHGFMCLFFDGLLPPGRSTFRSIFPIHFPSSILAKTTSISRCTHSFLLSTEKQSPLPFNANGLPFASAFQCPLNLLFLASIISQHHQKFILHGFQFLVARRHVLVENIEVRQRQIFLKLIRLSNLYFISTSLNTIEWHFMISHWESTKTPDIIST